MPTWLSGTYVRNGPAQIRFSSVKKLSHGGYIIIIILSFGSSRRVLASWLEGFAKLHSFKLAGRSLLYSGAMLASPNYVASVEQGELVPQVRNEDLRDHLEKSKTQENSDRTILAIPLCESQY